MPIVNKNIRSGPIEQMLLHDISGRIYARHCSFAQVFYPMTMNQKAFFNPASPSTAFAVCRDLILLSTGKFLPETGLNQIS